MKNLADKASRYATRAAKERVAANDDAIRDWLDIQTGGDLDCVEMDLLVDAVLRRMAAADA